MKRIISAVIVMAATLAVSFSAMAQTKTKFQDFNSFSGIYVNGPFEVSVRQGYNYNVSWTVDEALMDYVEIYSRNHALNIEYNQKGIPSDLKKVYKGRNGRVAVLKVTVTLPEFSELNLTDSPVVDFGGVVFESGSLNIDATGNAKITGLSFNADKATIKLSKKANLTMDLNANEIDLTTSDNAIAIITQDSDKMTLTSSGSSSISAKGKSMDVSANAQNSSKILLDGSAKDMVANAQNSSEVDASAMLLNDAELTVNSATVIVNAAENLSVDLKGGAKVYFIEEPAIKVVNIQASTLTRYTGEVTRRKTLGIF